MVCVYGECHPPCTGFSARPETARTYAELINAATSSNIAAVVQISSRLPGYVVFNRERMAVQIKSCDKGQNSFIASLPIKNPTEERIAARLPRLDSGSEARLASLPKSAPSQGTK
jgi:hypothetical protein